MFGVLYHWLFGNSAGAEDVRQAIDELRESYESDTVTLGEPFIADESELEYSDRAKVVVPLRNAPYGADQRLLFDVPADRYDSTYEFIEVLDLLGVEFETMEDIDGMEVPITFVGGSLCVMWSELSDDEDTKKGKKGKKGKKEDNAETDKSGQDTKKAKQEGNAETDKSGQDTKKAKQEGNAETDKSGQDTKKGKKEDNAETDKSGQGESSAVIEVTDQTISTDEEKPRQDNQSTS